MRLIEKLGHIHRRTLYYRAAPDNGWGMLWLKVDHDVWFRAVEIVESEIADPQP